VLLELQGRMVGYPDATSIEAENNGRSLLRSTVRKATQLTGNALTRTANFGLVNRRLRASGRQIMGVFESPPFEGALCKPMVGLRGIF
jgi:hypothetical protein